MRDRASEWRNSGKSSNWRDNNKDGGRQWDGKESGRSSDWKDGRSSGRAWEERKRRDSTKWEENMDLEDDSKKDGKQQWGGKSWASNTSGSSKPYHDGRPSPGKSSTSPANAKDKKVDKKEADPMGGEWPESLK